jgi:hypothetical protein
MMWRNENRMSQVSASTGETRENSGWEKENVLKW